MTVLIIATACITSCEEHDMGRSLAKTKFTMHLYEDYVYILSKASIDMDVPPFFKTIYDPVLRISLGIYFNNYLFLAHI